MEQVVVIDALRTPIGTFGGKLKSMTAPELGSVVIGALYKNNSLNPDIIDEVVMGNVLSAGTGQGPARQAALKAGLKNTIPCTTVNKAGASGIKAVMYAMHQIACGDTEVMVAGGMESMSNVPYYLPDIRFGEKSGHRELQDGIIRDGLWDILKDQHMGDAAELCAQTYGFSRQQQDDYAADSYRRTQKAHEEGTFSKEITVVKIRSMQGKAEVIDRDEKAERISFEKIPKLPPLYQRAGTITSANSSTSNDGAAALLLMSESKAGELGLSPIARLTSQASTAGPPEWFTTATAQAIPRALNKAGKTLDDMDLFEIDDPFSVMALSCSTLLDIDPARINVHGGAVSLGHPLGCSGSRLLVTLLHALHHQNKTWGVAGIGHGGGGASAMIIEKLD